MIHTFFEKDKNGNITDNIKSTKEILKVIDEIAYRTPEKMNIADSGIFKLATTFINVKATRAQTKAINKNSESSENLTKIGHYLTGAIIFLGIIQIIIAIINKT